VVVIQGQVIASIQGLSLGEGPGAVQYFGTRTIEADLGLNDAKLSRIWMVLHPEGVERVQPGVSTPETPSHDGAP
jgi:hypothetical protein